MAGLPATDCWPAGNSGSAEQAERGFTRERTTRGGPSGRRCWYKPPGVRTGFSNAHLIAAVALFVVITLLLQIQSGALNPQSLLPAKAPSTPTGGSKAKRSKDLEMLPGAPVVTASPPRFNAVPPPLRRIPRQESIQAFARMDGAGAAAILRELPPERAVEILAQLKERDIARILEVAPPADAAQWMQLLLEIRTPPDLPADLLPPEADLPAGDGTELPVVDGTTGEDAIPAAPEATDSGEAPVNPADAAPSADGATPANPTSPTGADSNAAGPGGPTARDTRRSRPNLA